MGFQKKEFKTYISILNSDGTFRIPSEEGAPGAVARKWETSDGKSGVKYEQVFHEFTGRITYVEFKDGDYGKQIIVELNDGKETQYLAMNAGGSFGTDFMKKLPNIQLDQEVTLAPFSFDGDKIGKNGEPKKIRGITIYQNDEKLENFFFDKEKKKTLHNFPEPEDGGDGFDSDDWTAYFTQVKKFLIRYTQENITFPERAPDTRTAEEAITLRTNDEVTYDNIADDDDEI